MNGTIGRGSPVYDGEPVADPWSILGLGPGSSLEDAKAARRRLAKQLHPDLHAGRPAGERAELARRMTLVNLALAELEAGATGPGKPERPSGPDAGPAWAGATEPSEPDAEPAPRRKSGPDEARPGWWAEPGVGRGGAGTEQAPAGASPRAPGQEPPRSAAEAIDTDSFTVAALPVEAFEALFLVGYGLGDILVADEPYALEIYLAEPAPCFCQLSLVPVAGGSIVTVDLAAAEGGDPPPDEAVRDLLVDELNRLAAAAP